MTGRPAYRTRRTLLLAGFFAVFAATPLAVSAASFSAPLPVIKSVGLQAAVQVDGKPVKSPVTVGAGAEFTIGWRSLGTGCVSNWSEEPLSPTGSAVGSITKARAF